MIVMKTDSISNFKFFQSSYLASTKQTSTNDELVLNVKNNMFILLDFAKRGTVVQTDYINKKMLDTYSFNVTMSEHIIANKSESTLVVELRNIKTNISIYYVGTQMKQPFQNWKVVAQIAGWNKLIHTVVSDIVKTIR